MGLKPIRVRKSSFILSASRNNSQCTNARFYWRDSFMHSSCQRFVALLFVLIVIIPSLLVSSQTSQPSNISLEAVTGSTAPTRRH